VRIAVLLLLMLSAGVSLSLLSGEDSGYLLLAWNGWRVEVNNLVLAFALLLLLFLLLHWVLNSFVAMQRGQKLFRRWRIVRRDHSGTRSLMQGLRQLVEGRWEPAEEKLLRAAERSQSPLLGYLGAAQAADQQGEVDRRDRYLAAAARSSDRSALAIGLARAKALAEDGQIDKALVVLVKLQQAEPRHPQVLKLLHQLYLQSHDWQSLLDLLPSLHRQKLTDQQQSAALSRRCHLELLKNADNLHDAWRQLPKKWTQDPEMLCLYLQVLVDDGQADRAAALAQRELNKELDSELLGFFGRLESGDSAQSLALVEKWLAKNPTDPALLLAAARIAVRAEFAERAVEFYEASIAIHTDPAACRELAQLLLGREQPDEAIKYFQQGLDLVLQ